MNETQKKVVTLFRCISVDDVTSQALFEASKQVLLEFAATRVAQFESGTTHVYIRTTTQKPLQLLAQQLNRNAHTKYSHFVYRFYQMK